MYVREQLEMKDLTCLKKIHVWDYIFGAEAYPDRWV